MANGLLVLGLLGLFFLWAKFMPEEIKRKMIRAEIEDGLRDGSIEANMRREKNGR